MEYQKLYEDEDIQLGDVIELEPITNKVTRAKKRLKGQSVKVIGVCNKIENNNILVADRGMVDVNVYGLICIGDKLTPSLVPGKAQSIKYRQDETQFGIRSIGKVINLYQTYNIAKVLLDIE